MSDDYFDREVSLSLRFHQSLANTNDGGLSVTTHLYLPTGARKVVVENYIPGDTANDPVALSRALEDVREQSVLAISELLIRSSGKPMPAKRRSR